MLLRLLQETLITIKNVRNSYWIVACFKGEETETDSLNREFGFNPAEIDYMVLSHAHMYRPLWSDSKLVNKGLQRQSLLTYPTKDLAQILLWSSAHIQRNRC